MAEFSIHPVHLALKPYIRFYFLMQTQDTLPSSSLLTATTDSCLLFHFGSKKSNIRYEFPNSPNRSYTFHKHDSWLGGMHNEPLNCLFGKDVNTIVAIFTCVGVHHLLKDNTTGIINQGFSLETLGLKKKFADLSEKLETIIDKTKALQLVETHLLNYFCRLNIPFSIKNMSPVANYISQQKGVVTIKHLEDKFHISRRWLEKQFSSQIGFSPKEYARITRFKAIVGHVMTTPSVSLSTLISNYNYYDQSHFIRDFQEYAGQTPSQFFKNLLPENVANDVNSYFYRDIE